MAWMNVAEYCKKKGIKCKQIVYQKIAKGQMKEKVREVDVIVKRKEIFYEY